MTGNPATVFGRLFAGRRPAAAADDGRVAGGWTLDDVEAAFIYQAPRPVAGDGHLFEVPCPVDATLRIARRKDGELAIADGTQGRGPLTPKKMEQFVHLTPRDRWRHPDRPLVQCSTPYRFVADEPVHMSQLPPYLARQEPPWPGTLICGRLPIDVWPRLMMWAFEWHEPAKPLVLRRGSPWFYVRFETADPTRACRMVAAERTPEYIAYCRGLDGVPNYVNRTFTLFATARSRRPRRLLVERDGA